MKRILRGLIFLVSILLVTGAGISSELPGDANADKNTSSGSDPVGGYPNEEYSVAEMNAITTPEGLSGHCYAIFSNEENMKKICQDYYEKEKNEYEECLSKKVKGEETEAALKAIDKICYKKSNSTAWKYIKWYLEEKKFENYFTAEKQVSN